GAIQRDGLEQTTVQHRRDVGGPGAGEIEARDARLARRGADDAAVDERRAAGRHDLTDLPRGGGRDRVAVDVDAGEALGSDFLGDVRRGRGWAHGEDHLRLARQAREGADVFEAVRLRALARGRAPALGDPQHTGPGR